MPFCGEFTNARYFYRSVSVQTGGHVYGPQQS